MATRRLVGEHERLELWAMWKRGESVSDIARALERKPGTIHCLLTECGGIAPPLPRPSARALTLLEREEISRGIATGNTIRSMARSLNRSPSTISREIIRNGGRTAYRAHSADSAASIARRRPKRLLLSSNTRLREGVVSKLAEDWSPEQISGWLRTTHADSPELQVSHEAIYRALYLHHRSGLPAELRQRLQTRRKLRKSRYATTSGQRRGQIVGAVPIAQRPEYIDKRKETGHWEGDLITGRANTHIATLVERCSRFTVLVRVTAKDADTVAEDLTAAFRKLPPSLVRTLTWDRGKELAKHVSLPQETGLAIYFCDPKSPWQRGRNENMNRLLRQYFPKGMRLDQFTQADLDGIAARLNRRPRKILHYATPLGALDAMLH